MSHDHSRPVPWGGRQVGLVRELSRREILGRYRGAMFGVAWSFLAPFLMLAVYALAFGHLLKSRWPGVESTSDFVLILFVGLLTHGFLGECLMRAPTLVTGNANYVKRVVFPLHLLPWPMIAASLFHVGTNLLALAIGLLIVRGEVPWTFVLAPLVLLPLVLVVAGLSWALGALGVYFRDIGQMMPPVVTALLFLSSAIIPLQNVPEDYLLVFQLNPLTLVIDQLRRVTLDGQLPELLPLLLYSGVALIVFVLGFAWFQRTRRGFADVL